MPASNQPTPPSSTSSNGASPDGRQFRVVRKRNRIPLSCAPCRHRKLKCNRAHPCDNCTKRDDAANCSYATPGSRRKAGAGPSMQPEDMQNRIDRLENLVLSLMPTDGSQKPGSLSASASIDVQSDMIPEEEEYAEGEDSEVEQVSKDIGFMKVDNGKSWFASSSHWTAVLFEIGEVRKYFETHKEDHKRQWAKIEAAAGDHDDGPAFLLQGIERAEHADLLAAFPPKADADRLISRYFNAYDPSVHIIHGPTFQKQYDKHWLDPQETSVVWLGKAYGMMTLALQSYHRSDDEPPEYKGNTRQLSQRYRVLTAQCLLLGDITQPQAQVLETMILHLQAEHGRNKYSDPRPLLIMSCCVQLAMRMGYHRDPGPHPQITAFQGEMRRRVFTYIRLCDLVMSFQYGLPAIIRSDNVDMRPPRNLYDDELYEDMPSLPPSRPSFEATPMSYMIAKSKIGFIFGRIMERVSSLTNLPSYEETMRLDQELRDARASHPPWLKMRSFAESARDPANLIMQRLAVEMIYLRSLFVLHRRFVARGRENPRYAYSRNTCLDSSMQLLSHQAALHQESRPGGRLRSVKWHISSVTTHDFLLAAMLVCLDLYHMAEADRLGRRTALPATPVADDYCSLESRAEMLRAVQHCLGIWDTLRDHSMDAYKASSALRIMVHKLKSYSTTPSGDSTAGPCPTDSASQAASASAPSPARPAGFDFGQRSPYGGFNVNDMSGVENSDLAPEQSAAMTLGMLSSGGLSPAPGFGGMSPLGGNVSGVPDRQGFPSSMAALLNEPVSGERSGLTPGYSGVDASGVSAGLGGASPFSSFFGQGAMLTDGMGTDLDWGAWDNYIANNSAMDPAMSTWPVNFDNGVADAAGANTGSDQRSGNGGHDGAAAVPGSVYSNGTL